MLEIDYDQKKGGWQDPHIRPHEEFTLDPTNFALQYNVECFEGLKAYRTPDDRVSLFRVDRNYERLNSSHAQLGFPIFDVLSFTECLLKLIDIEREWIPK